MKVLWYNSTPLAGMPWRTALTMNGPLQKAGGWARSLIQNPGAYGPRVFPNDLDWGSPAAMEAIREADLAIVGAYMKPTIPLRPELPVVHHYSTEHFRWHNKNPAPGTATVVGQYQAQFAPQLDILPNCIPIDDPMFSPGEKASDVVRIVYSPSSQASQGWGAKSYPEVFQALRIVAARAKHGEYPTPVEVYVLEGRPYSEVMAAKRHAHIVIDELSTGSYHSSGLEGLACGAVTVCWLSNEVIGTLGKMLAPGALDEGLPFERVPKSKILGTLEMLIANPDILRLRGRWSREWMETWYSETWQASTWIDWHRRYLKNSGATLNPSSTR